MERAFIPAFSPQEKVRHWALVRREMKKTNLDALICLPNQGHWDQFGADARYLTQIGGFQTEVAVVFPLEANVTAVVRGPNEVEWWGLAQDWVVDIRPSRRSYGEPVIQRLKEVRAERVGVVALLAFKFENEDLTHCEISEEGIQRDRETGSVGETFLSLPILT